MKIELVIISYKTKCYKTNSDSPSPKFSIGDYQSHPMKS